MRRALFACTLGLLAGCGFNPDLSRFPKCGPAGECAPGSLCLTEEQRCVPSCGESCADAGTDAGVDAGLPDAGSVMDAGDDAGADAGVDAGTDAGPLLALASATLPAAIETKPYSHTFVPTGGQSPWFFSIDGGVPGFSLSATGDLATSAATTVGLFPFSITVQDSDTPRAQVTTGFSLEVRPLLRVASAAPLVEGRQGQAYLQPLSATGGTAPYRWVVDGGTPPAGLSLVDGGFQGSPSATGVVTFGVSVSDSATPPQVASRTLSIETKVLDTLLVIATHGAADGRVGTPYSQGLKAYGGTSNYTWSVVSGNPPPGVGLVAAVLSGTPTASGTFTFTVRCGDGLTTQNQVLSITVY
jgi:hypothetical protein